MSAYVKIRRYTIPKISFTGRDGIIRCYDNSGTTWAGGGPGTSFYIQVPFASMNFSGAAAKPRPIDPIIVTSGGYDHGPASDDYERVLYEPVSLSFSCLIDDTTNRLKLRQALCNVDLDSPWKVGSDTWASTKGRGSIILPDGTFVGTKAFFDTRKVSIEIQVIWESTQAASRFGLAYDEVYVAPQNIEISESSDMVELIVREALAYGNISPITVFRTGRES